MLIGVVALVVLIAVGAVAFLAGKTKPAAATNAGNVAVSAEIAPRLAP